MTTKERLYRYSKKLLAAGHVNQAKANFEKLGDYKDSVFLQSVANCNRYRLPNDKEKASRIQETYITALELCLLEGGNCEEAARIVSSIKEEYRLTGYMKKVANVKECPGQIGKPSSLGIAEVPVSEKSGPYRKRTGMSTETRYGSTVLTEQFELFMYLKKMGMDKYSELVKNLERNGIDIDWLCFYGARIQDLSVNPEIFWIRIKHAYRFGNNMLDENAIKSLFSNKQYSSITQ